MKRIGFTLLLLALAVACRPQAESPALQTGDLLFTGLPMAYLPGAEDNPAVDSLTCAGDNLNLIHVSILEVEGDSVWVIDATLRRGVARYPLADFLADFTLGEGSLPWFVVARLDPKAAGMPEGALSPKAFAQYISRAKSFVGKPYDVEFSNGNGALYCSELVRESYVTPAGDTLFAEGPINWANDAGAVAPYWGWLFEMAGCEAPAGIGTTPASLLKSPLLKKIEGLRPS